MKKILTSFGFDGHDKLLEIAAPSFYRYSSKHSYDCFFPSQGFFSDKTKTYPYSWWKVELLSKLLHDYDLVLWIDSDVLICDDSLDISDSLMPQDHMGLVIHDVPIGKIPNCGVWVLTQQSLNWLDNLWQHNRFSRSSGWWEQAAVMHELGFDPDETVVSLPKHFNIPFKELDYLWNPHVHDRRGLPQDLRFLHFTMFTDRLAAMKKIASQLGY
jgi:hypothetical protein